MSVTGCAKKEAERRTRSCANLLRNGVVQSPAQCARRQSQETRDRACRKHFRFDSAAQQERQWSHGVFLGALPAMQETPIQPVQPLLAAQDGRTRIAESAWRCRYEKQTQCNSARLFAEEALYQTDLQKRESKKYLRWGRGGRRSNSRRKGLFSTLDGYRQAVGPGWPSDLMRGRLPR